MSLGNIESTFAVPNSEIFESSIFGMLIGEIRLNVYLLLADRVSDQKREKYKLNLRNAQSGNK